MEEFGRNSGRASSVPSRCPARCTCKLILQISIRVSSATIQKRGFEQSNESDGQDGIDATSRSRSKLQLPEIQQFRALSSSLYNLVHVLASQQTFIRRLCPLCKRMPQSSNAPSPCPYMSSKCSLLLSLIICNNGSFTTQADSSRSAVGLQSSHRQARNCRPSSCFDTRPALSYAFARRERPGHLVRRSCR